jgi:hypothetical protein
MRWDQLQHVLKKVFGIMSRDQVKKEFALADVVPVVFVGKPIIDGFIQSE